MKFYGYGIIDSKGKAWWDESCVCQDRGPLQDLVDETNNHPDQVYNPLRVVALYYRTAKPPWTRGRR